MGMITPDELARWQAQGLDFVLLDVRRAGARREAGATIAGSRWLDPAAWLDWKDGIVADNGERPLVLYCAHGHEIGQGLTAALRAMGADARFLAGGFSGWVDADQPVRRLPQEVQP